jgi:hypothetical protein
MSTNERQTRREWDLHSEEPGTERTEPIWWGVTLGSSVYAVKAFNEDDAVTKAQDLLGGEPFPIFIVHPHDEGAQPLLEALYEGRDAVHVIPFSPIEYPEDANNMSAEQQQAFDRLKRSDS